jgi:phosphoribosylaminoimidazole-succinocarboxamide synthase
MLHTIDLEGLPLFRRGKVRDTWDLGDTLLIVASDRISAFDVILPNDVPDKGQVLTQLSAFWFDRTSVFQPNHLLSTSTDDLPPAVAPWTEQIAGRFMLVRKARRIDIECVVRGYLAGSAWNEYRTSGTVCSAPLPPEMVESQQLEEPIFTPAIKADSGHDENISIDRMASLVGSGLTSRLIDASLALYRAAAEYARTRGVILADSKFEFGYCGDELLVIDEIFTPDSSRFWDAEQYHPGRPQESFDKQPVRDWLVATGWDKQPPAPALPDEVIAQTSHRYREAYRRLVGRELPQA